MTRSLYLIACVALLLPVSAARADDDELQKLRAEIEAQQARIEALEVDDVARAAQEDKDGPFRIYGFIDVGIQKMFVGDGSQASAIFPTNKTTFVLGNLNLYFDAHPLEHWRALFELRITSAPNGSDAAGTPFGAYTRTSTQVFDQTSSSGGWSSIRWGALILERAYIEWRHSDYLTVRAGTFLTPAGIWNVDHGSPTLIALMMPYSLIWEMFPMRQTGVQLLGTHHFAPWALDYVAYVSNGRVAAELDPTDDKAFGGRLVLRRSGKQRLALGTSFYVGRFSDQRRDIVQLEPFRIERTETVAFQEQSVGLDASLDLGPLRLRSELTLHHVVYDDGKRMPFYGSPVLQMPDHNEVDGYVLAAYQLPWLGLEPFANLEAMRLPMPLGEAVIAPSVGLNVHFTPAATLKAQLMRTIFVGNGATSSSDMTFAAARLVLAF